MNLVSNRAPMGYTVRYETKEESAQFEKDWNTLQSTIQKRDNALANIVIAQAQRKEGTAMRKEGEAMIAEASIMREKKRSYIIEKLDSAEILLNNKVNLVYSLNVEKKSAVLEELKELLTKSAELKVETGSAASVENVGVKFTALSQEINLICKKIKQM